jgi:hypothetical protein
MSALILWIVIAGLATAVWLRRLEQRRLLKRAVQSRLEVIRREAEQEWAIAELASMVPQKPGGRSRGKGESPERVAAFL